MLYHTILSTLLFCGSFAGATEYTLNFQRNRQLAPGASMPYLSGSGKTSSVEGYECLIIDSAYTPLEIKTPDCLKKENGSIRFHFMPRLLSPEPGKLLMHTLFYSPDNAGGSVQIGINNYGEKSQLPYFLISDPAQKLVNYGPYREYALKKNRWHAFEISWDQENMTVTIDGNLADSRPRKAGIPWGETIVIGGKKPGYDRADGLLANLSFSDQPLPFRGQKPLVMAQEKSGTHRELQQLRDDENGYFFFFESPDSNAEIKVTPGIFKICRGDRLWVENTGGMSYETVAAKDGELILKSAPSLFSQVMISHTVPNLAGGVKFDVSRLTAELPTIFARHEGLNISPWWKEAGKKLGEQQEKITLKTQADGATVIARSTAIALQSGKQYLATCRYRTDGLQAGNGLVFAAIIEDDQKQEYFTTGYNFRRNEEPAGTELTFSISVPASYRTPRCRLLLIASGKPFQVVFSDLDLRPTPYLTYKIPRGLTSEQTTPSISAEQVQKMLTQRTPSVPGTQEINGRTVFTLNGKPAEYLSYYAFPNERGCRQFGDDGFRLQYLFCRAASGDNRFWLDSGKYDFSVLDRYLERAMRAAPNAEIMLSLGCDPYYGFASRYPDAVSRNENNQKLLYNWRPLPESPDDPYMIFYASPDYLRECSDMIRALCAHLKQSPFGKAVIGVHIKGGWDEQWFPPHFIDRAPDSLNAFRNYLKQEYKGDLAAFRKAWGDDKLLFETAEFVPWNQGTGFHFLDPAKPTDRRVMDMYRYRSAYPVQVMRQLAVLFKKEMGRPFWVSTYYSDGRAGSDLGKDRLIELLQGDVIDAVASCIPYGGFRLPGEPGASYSHTGSIDLHGKKQWAELDYRTDFSNYSHRGGAGYDRQTSGAARGHKEHRAQMQRDLGLALTANQGGWFFSLAGLTWADESFRKQMQEALSAARQVHLNPSGEDRPPLAVFLDDNTSCYSRINNFSANLEVASSVELMRSLNVSGLGYDSYELGDLTNAKLPKYKIYYFARAPHLSDAQIAFIREKLQRDGNILIFSFDAARLSSGGMEKSIRELTGINVKAQIDRTILYRNKPGKSRTALGRTLDYTGTEIVAPLIYVDDASAELLAVFKQSPGYVSAALKRHRDWTAVYLAAPGGISPEFLNRLALENGVKPTATPGDALYTGNRVIVLHALTGGVKQLQWPEQCDLIDLSTGEIVAKQATRCSFNLPAGESRWFMKTNLKKK